MDNLTSWRLHPEFHFEHIPPTWIETNPSDGGDGGLNDTGSKTGIGSVSANLGAVSHTLFRSYHKVLLTCFLIAVVAIGISILSLNRRAPSPTFLDAISTCVLCETKTVQVVIPHQIPLILRHRLLGMKAIQNLVLEDAKAAMQVVGGLLINRSQYQVKISSSSRSMI